MILFKYIVISQQKTSFSFCLQSLLTQKELDAKNIQYYLMFVGFDGSGQGTGGPPGLQIQWEA